MVQTKGEMANNENGQKEQEMANKKQWSKHKKQWSKNKKLWSKQNKKDGPIHEDMAQTQEMGEEFTFVPFPDTAVLSSTTVYVSTSLLQVPHNKPAYLRQWAVWL